MGTQDQWERRRFLALAGGTTILAGCAAEPIEDEATSDEGGEAGNTEEEDTDEDDSEPSEETPTEDNTSDTTPDDADGDSDLITSMPEAEGMLAVSGVQIQGSDGSNEWIELTNVGSESLDMSGWHLQDRYDEGMVDGRGFDPVVFPSNFVLEPDESVRIVTGSGEDTDTTIHWGYEQQIWNEDGDMVIVLDPNNEPVLESELGNGGDREGGNGNGGEGDPGNGGNGNGGNGGGGNGSGNGGNGNGGNGNGDGNGGNGNGGNGEGGNGSGNGGNGNGGNGNGNSGNNGSDDPEEPPLSVITTQVVGPAGEPIEGASVTGEGEPHEADIPLEFSGETDSDGVHKSRIYENEYTIEIDHPDYEATTIEHTHDGESEIRVELETAVDTSAFTLTVTDSEGEPIEGASVTGQGEPHEANIPLEFSGETNSNGEYNDVIYENEYTIEVNHPGYESTSIEHTHDGETEVTVELEPKEPPVSKITIEVVDTNGEPIEDARISGNGESNSADIPLQFDGETNADGVLSTPVYENEYRISITHPYYTAETIYHTHDGETEVTVELTRNVEEVQLVLTVTDSDDEPIEGASVVGEGHLGSESPGFSGETNSDGQYSVALLETTYTIEINHDGYETKDFELPLREDTEFSVELEPDNGDEE